MPKPTRTSATRVPVKPFNHGLYGQIVTPPKFYFPDVDLDPSCPIPAGMLTDPCGAGAAALQFLAGFTVPEGRAVGRNLVETMAPYQKADIVAVHGHRDPATWTRYINWSPFICARKNAKTWRMAVHALIGLFSTHEPAGSIVVAAGSQTQARRTFELALAILKTNPARFGQIKMQDHLSTMTNIVTNTTLKAVPCAPDRLFGLSPSMLLLDELHAWAGGKAHQLLQSLVTGMGARRNPLILHATTVPDEPPNPTDVFSETLSRARKIIAGEIVDARALPLVWVTPADADASSEQVWRDANPGIGYSLDISEMRESYEAATGSDNAMASFKSMRLNMVPTTSLDAGWLQGHVIERSVQAFDDEDVLASPFRALGLDLGGGWDLESIALVAQDSEGKIFVKQTSFISADGFDRLKSAGEPVQEFVKRGELVIAGASAVPIDMVVAELVDIAMRFEVDTVIADMAMVPGIQQALQASGLEIVAGRMGSISMTPVMYAMETAASEGRLAIGDDQVLAWALRNTAVVSSNNGRRPCKIGRDDTSNPKKFDPVAAALLAMQLVQEAINTGAGSGSSKSASVYQVDPWSEPINSVALSEGGEYMADCGAMEVPGSGGIYRLINQ